MSEPARPSDMPMTHAMSTYGLGSRTYGHIVLWFTFENNQSIFIFPRHRTTSHHGNFEQIRFRKITFGIYRGPSKTPMPHKICIWLGNDKPRRRIVCMNCSSLYKVRLLRSLEVKGDLSLHCVLNNQPEFGRLLGSAIG